MLRWCLGVTDYPLGGYALADAAQSEAIRSADIYRRIQNTIPLGLTSDLAGRLEEQMGLGRVAEVAFTARQALEEQLAKTGAVMVSVREAFGERLTAQMSLERMAMNASLASTAHLAAQANQTVRDSFAQIKAIGNAFQGARNLQEHLRTIDLTAIQRATSIGQIADISRMSEMLAGPSSIALQAMQTSGAFDAIRDSLGGSWHEALNSKLVAQAQASLEAELAADPDRSIVEAIMAAVSNLATFVDHPNGGALANWIYLLCATLFAIVLMQAQEQDSKDGAADTAWSIQRLTANQDRILTQLATKSLNHGTRLWSRPDSGSKVLGRLGTGTLVISQDRKGKWTQVFVRASESPTGSAVTGWMLNKYLR